MNIVRLAVCLALGSALAAPLAYAQTPDPSTATGAGTTSPDAASSPHQREAMKNAPGQDKAAMAAGQTGGATPATFVTKAGQDGMTEVALGKLALEKSKSQNVRSFADHMVKDHGKANDELTTIAARKHYDVPKSLDAKHQAVVSEMQAKSGAEFDAAYADHMAMAHNQAIALFKDASGSSDPDLAGFASKTLPTLQEHKKMADALKSTVKTASADSASRE